jgi:hypothetical protein
VAEQSALPGCIRAPAIAPGRAVQGSLHPQQSLAVRSGRRLQAAGQTTPLAEPLFRTSATGSLETCAAYTRQNCALNQTGKDDCGKNGTAERKFPRLPLPKRLAGRIGSKAAGAAAALGPACTGGRRECGSPYRVCARRSGKALETLARQAPRASREVESERNRRRFAQCAKPTSSGDLGEVKFGTIRANVFM